MTYFRANSVCFVPLELVRGSGADCRTHHAGANSPTFARETMDKTSEHVTNFEDKNKSNPHKKKQVLGILRFSSPHHSVIRLCAWHHFLAPKT